MRYNPRAMARSTACYASNRKWHAVRRGAYRYENATMNGIELARAIKSDSSIASVKLIMLSSMMSTGEASAAREQESPPA